MKIQDMLEKYKGEFERAEIYTRDVAEKSFRASVLKNYKGNSRQAEVADYKLMTARQYNKIVWGGKKFAENGNILVMVVEQ